MTTFAPSFQILPLHAIVPSPTNPRKHFDQAALDELADSIKATVAVDGMASEYTFEVGEFELVEGGAA